MALSATGQEDWASGMYRGRRAPANAVYDAVNVLVTDEGLLSRRGGSRYKSDTNAGATLLGLADVYVGPGQRTIFTSGNTTDGSWVLDTDDQSPVALPLAAWRPLARVASASGVVFLPGSADYAAPVLVYGGSRKLEYLSNFGPGLGTTITVTRGSTAVTGTGTAFLANVEAGMILTVTPTLGMGVVKSVDSDSTMTLASPWNGPTATGTQYSLVAVSGLAPGPVENYATNDAYVTSVGAVSRLVVAVGQRAFISERGDPFTFEDSSYMELPSDALIIGAESIMDAGVIFTTRGVWALSNLTLDSVDDYGNIQWQQEQISKDVILWGDPGVAAWANALVVPAVDDVYIFGLGQAPVPITGQRGNQYDGGIRDLYRGYVAAGYAPGTASVHRGHYLLPILNGTALVDALVCRLDRGFAWTRWANGAAGRSYAQRVGATARQPKLLGLAGQRVTDLTGCFDPTSANATDADGTAHVAEITSRDFPTGQQPGFVQKARLRYELEDGGTPDPAVAIAFSSDADGGTFTTLTERAEQGGAPGWGVSDGSKYQWALVGKRRERIRFRVRVTGACSRFVLRSIELLTRPQGKQ